LGRGRGKKNRKSQGKEKCKSGKKERAQTHLGKQVFRGFKEKRTTRKKGKEKRGEKTTEVLGEALGSHSGGKKNGSDFKGNGVERGKGGNGFKCLVKKKVFR